VVVIGLALRQLRPSARIALAWLNRMIDVLPIVILIGALAVIVFFVENLPRAKKARRQRYAAESVERTEAIKEMARRHKEKEREEAKFEITRTFYGNVDLKSTGDPLFDHFQDSCEAISCYAARFIFIRNQATRVVVLNCYDKGEWGFDDLWQDPNADIAGVASWCASWQSKRRTSQIFKTRKAALAAWNKGEVWFDFNLESLEQVKAAHDSGEVLNVRYWGGSRSGQDRYVSITELNQLEAFEPGDPELWYAEVKEVDTGAEKTYRVDRMQIVPTNLRDRILDSLEDA